MCLNSKLLIKPPIKDALEAIGVERKRINDLLDDNDAFVNKKAI